MILKSSNNQLEITILITNSPDSSYDSLSAQDEVDFCSFIITTEGLIDSNELTFIKSYTIIDNKISHYFEFYSKDRTRYTLIARLSNETGVSYDEVLDEIDEILERL